MLWNFFVETNEQVHRQTEKVKKRSKITSFYHTSKIIHLYQKKFHLTH